MFCISWVLIAPPTTCQLERTTPSTVELKGRTLERPGSSLRMNMRDFPKKSTVARQTEEEEQEKKQRAQQKR